MPRRLRWIAFTLDDLRQWRNMCDYDDEVSNLVDMVEQAIAGAQRVLDALR